VPQELNEHTSLDDWLGFIEKISSINIKLGLNRTNKVKENLKLNIGFPIILVGGTNGKGSTCSFLESIYKNSSYKVGCYTSPHLIRFNERIRINKNECVDQHIVQSFKYVNDNRMGVPLTYFEFITLAAIKIFCDNKIDVAILEVGLGGRLDAVNAFNPEISIITSLSLDHQEYLGDKIDQIAYEKSGIFRSNKHAIINTKTDQDFLIQGAKRLKAKLSIYDKDYSFKLHKKKFSYISNENQLDNLPFPKFSGLVQFQNITGAIRVTELLNDKLMVGIEAIKLGIINNNIAGRMDIIKKNPLIIFDVAHNEEAAKNLLSFTRENKQKGKLFAVFSILSNKNVDDVIKPFIDLVDEWFISKIDNVRGLNVFDIKNILIKYNSSAVIHICESLPKAYEYAYNKTSLDDNIVVYGSFFTITEIMKEKYCG
jgi:dihydrofolate synthase/folylpolyglutamate synthase